MRVRMFGPMSRYAPVAGGGRQMTSWGPNQVVDVDDSDVAGIEFYERMVADGQAELLDEGARPTLATTTTTSAGTATTAPPDRRADYEAMTHESLTDEIRRRNDDEGADLKITGAKHELVDRLVGHDTERPSEQE